MSALIMLVTNISKFAWTKIVNDCEVTVAVTQRVVIISHRPFGTTYQHIYKGQESNAFLTLTMLLKNCPETSVKNYH